MRIRRTPLALAAGVAITLGAAAPLLLAGPPLICHPVQVEGLDADGLPWSTDPFRGARGFDRDTLPQATLEALEPGVPVLARMETLRRATLYAQEDRALALRTLAALQGRALDAAAAGQPSAMAFFDAGYFVQCLAQMGHPVRDVGVKDGVAGYAWVARAIELAPEEQLGQLQFAAALVTALAGPANVHQGYLRKARAAAENDRVLAANIEYFERELGPNLDHHRDNDRRAGG